MTKDQVFRAFDLEEVNPAAYAAGWLDGREGGELDSVNPATGEVLGFVRQADAATCDRVIGVAERTFREWRTWPAPRRGDLVHALGNQLRAHKQALGRLVSMEMGKILAEGLGEVQEMIDMCDFAVGLSRQLYGLTIASERPRHRLIEQWHPLGPLGVVT